MVLDINVIYGCKFFIQRNFLVQKRAWFDPFEKLNPSSKSKNENWWFEVYLKTKYSKYRKIWYSKVENSQTHENVIPGQENDIYIEIFPQKYTKSQSFFAKIKVPSGREGKFSFTS